MQARARSRAPRAGRHGSAVVEPLLVQRAGGERQHAQQREHDLRADLVALLAVLVDEDRILEPLERERLARVVLAAGLAHDLDAGRRDVE